jgi:hypothetical protein
MILLLHKCLPLRELMGRKCSPDFLKNGICVTTSKNICNRLQSFSVYFFKYE